MNRRTFLKGALSTLGVGAGLTNRRLSAGLQCLPVYPGVQRCQVGIDSFIAAVIIQNQQQQSRWCWAACIEMVFRYYGHFVPQHEIVRQAYGTIADLTGYPQQIMASLNRPWIDANGRPFRVFADSYSCNPVTVAQDLALDRPIIIGTAGHAVLLTALTYDLDLQGNYQIIAATVRDPWPGKGVRTLTPYEMQSTTFAARIRVL